MWDWLNTGIKLSYLAKYAARYGLKGVETLVGVPGSIGGAVVMNAGAEGTEIGQVIRSVKRITLDGEIQSFNKDEMNNLYLLFLGWSSIPFEPT